MNVNKRSEYVEIIENDLEDYSMYGTSTKKMLNMLILDILKEHSDSEHNVLV